MTVLVENLARRIAAQAKRPLVIGVNGAQGSGKSTLCRALAARLAAGHGLRPASLSIDDLYLTRAERLDLAANVQPLLATRGVPGTHDVGLGLDLLDAAKAGEPLRLPRFDKARDDRCPDRMAVGVVDVLLFEGWCVGARPQSPAALAVPVNALERTEDPDGRWRRFVNTALAGPYQTLFARIDWLVMLAAPQFEVVAGWRAEQEAGLRAATGGGMAPREIARFTAHYERLTRAMLAEMPARADCVVSLDATRRVMAIKPE